MTSAIIIALCVLVILSYVFDLSASKTRIPTVILLLALGGLVRYFSAWFSIQLPDLSALLPILGTIGLILIVLEGSLELQLHRSKLTMIFKSFWMALIPILLLSGLAAFVLQFAGYPDFKTNLGNMIPLSIISSAIAIPTARNLSQTTREFVVYETSLSDIFGVILFNFIVLNEVIDFNAFLTFFMQLTVEAFIAFLATLFLAFLLSKIEHHIKFVPIIFLIILIYAISKEFHLPALLFILIFGLFLGNLDEIKGWKWLEKLNPGMLDREVLKFKEITTEATFLIRSLFFLLFGYLLQLNDILNPQSILWAMALTAAMFVLRAILLKIFKFSYNPLLFIAPRGLITILLFLSIPGKDKIALVNNSLVVQVILLTILIMMVGILVPSGDKKMNTELMDTHVVPTNKSSATEE